MGGRLMQGAGMQGELASISDTLSQKLSDLSASYGANMSNPMLGPIEVKPALIALLGAVAIALMLVLALVLIANTKRRVRFSSGRDQQSEAGIQRLLDEMRPLAGGDLSVEATVSDDISGTIAVSVNQAVEAIREPLWSNPGYLAEAVFICAGKPRPVSCSWQKYQNTSGSR